MRSAKKLGFNGFARFSHAGKFVIGRYEVAPQTQLFGYRQPLGNIPPKRKIIIDNLKKKEVILTKNKTMNINYCNKM